MLIVFSFIATLCERGKTIYHVSCGMLIAYKLRITYVARTASFLILIFWIKNVVNYKVL